MRAAVEGRREPPWWRRPGRRRPVVLLYHGFADARRDDDPENLFVPLPELDAQMGWLREQGWAVLTWQEWDEIVRGERPTPRRSVLVTIDDAYDSTREGLQVLARHQAPAVLYVPGGIIGQTAHWLPEPPDEPLLTREQLLEIREQHGQLLEIGVHGFDHTPMTDRDADALRRQTAEARDVLEDALQARVLPSFAYPFGSHDAAARSAVERAGFVSAFSVFDDVGRFAIARVDVNATDSLASFRLKLMPGYRAAWRLLDRFAFIRRGIRAVLTRSGDGG